MRFKDIVDRIEKEYTKYTSDEYGSVVLRDAEGDIIIHRRKNENSIEYAVGIYDTFKNPYDGDGWDFIIEQSDNGDFALDFSKSRLQHVYVLDECAQFEISSLDADVDHGDWDDLLTKYSIDKNILRVIEPTMPLIYRRRITWQDQ